MSTLALQLWRSICAKAPAYFDGQRKYLLLTEEACVAIGTALEAASIDTADHVLHVPSGETWLVAYVEGDRLAACGWPFSLVPVADCRLVKKAADDERLKLLHEMAAISAGDDLRARYARRVLEEAEA